MRDPASGVERYLSGLLAAAGGVPRQRPRRLIDLAPGPARRPVSYWHRRHRPEGLHAASSATLQAVPDLHEAATGELFARLDELVVGDVDDDALLDGLSAGQRLAAAVAAKALVMTAEFYARRVGPLEAELERAQSLGDADEIHWTARTLEIGARAVADEVALELSCSRSAAGHQVRTALTLTRELPRTLAALARGDIDPRKAFVMGDLIGAVEDPDIRARIEDAVLPRARDWNIPALREEFKKLLLRFDPEGAAEAHEKARGERRVAFTPVEDDMMELWALLPADDGARAKAALDIAADAARAPGDERTADQRRADALVDSLTASITHAASSAGEAGLGIEHPEECCDAPDSSPGQRPTAQESGQEPTAQEPGQRPAEQESGQRPTEQESGQRPTEQESGQRRTEQESGQRPTEQESGQRPTEQESGQRPTEQESGQRPTEQESGQRPTEQESGQEPTAQEPGRQPTAQEPGRQPTKKEQAEARKRARRRGRHGLRHEVQVVVPLETITGDADEPGYLTRYGPISAHLARKMAWEVAEQGVWRCVVTDDVHGTVMGLGSSTFSPEYESSQRLRRFVNARDRYCTFPGCRALAAACDKDHQVPWPRGATCECDVCNRCPHHHRVKHETGFQVRFSTDPEHPPGTVIWTTPAGREYPEFPAVVGVPRSQARTGKSRSVPAGDGFEDKGPDPGPPPF